MFQITIFRLIPIFLTISKAISLKDVTDKYHLLFHEQQVGKNINSDHFLIENAYQILREQSRNVDKVYYFIHHKSLCAILTTLEIHFVEVIL